MNKLKGVIAGVFALAMISTTATGVFADEFEFDGFFAPDFSIGESQPQSDEFDEALQEYQNLVVKLEEAQKNIEGIKQELDEKEYGSEDFENLKGKLEDAEKNIGDIKKEIEDAKEKLEDIQKGHHDVEIGDSDFDDDITIGDSDIIDNNKKYHNHDDFKEDKWQSSVSSDFIFNNNKKFKAKDNTLLKNAVLTLMDTYLETESYIADGTEDWWLKDKYQLTVKISSEDGDYQVKFNPILEDGKLTSCYMYVLAEDDTITEGYFITVEDYTTVKQSLNDTFLKDDVVAKVNGIEDFDDFIELIQSKYTNPNNYFYDVDGNLAVNVGDLIKTRRHILHLEVENDDINNYDTDENGKTNVADVIRLRQKLLHIIED